MKWKKGLLAAIIFAGIVFGGQGASAEFEEVAVQRVASGTSLMEDLTPTEVLSSTGELLGHSVVTFWYSKGGSAYNKIVAFCKTNNWNYKEVSRDDGKVRITVGTFTQRSSNKLKLEKFLVENEYNYTLELQGSGSGARQSLKKVDSFENRHRVITYWLTVGSSKYNKVMELIKTNSWNHKIEKAKDGRVRIIVSSFTQKSSNKFKLTKLLGDLGCNYTIELLKNKTVIDQRKIETEMFRLVNNLRASVGVNKLTEHTKLTTGSRIRSKELETKFSHTRPDGRSCFTVYPEVGIDYYSFAGENIAQNWVEEGDTEEMIALKLFTQWKNSPGHYANMINKNYTRIGFAVSIEDTGKVWGTQLFMKN